MLEGTPSTASFMADILAGSPEKGLSWKKEVDVALPVTLRVLGSGDSFGSDGRNPSGCLLQAGKSRILLDCGAGSGASLKRPGVAPGSVGLVLVGHLHADHVAGLPLLFHDYQYQTPRRAPLQVAGPPGTRRRVELLHQALFPSARPRRFSDAYRTLAEGWEFRPPGM